MATSRDLIPSFLAKSYEDKIILIRTLRALRRELHPKKVPKAKANKSKKISSSKAISIIEGIQGDALDKLIKRMEDRRSLR